MVVSVNSEPNKEEFNEILNSTIAELNIHAKKTPKKIGELRGNKLEPYVGDVMTELAVGTPFENSIEVIGGQKFPDIVAKKFYGIEVKTTTKNHWKTTGNSVLESTRIDDVERIYMLFGKLGKPIEFRCRAYEECLSEVVVTHSPRYLIDMNLEKGKTIFDKINTPYDTLRKKENPIKPITDYYKSKLKAGQDLWWIEKDNDENANNFIIEIWNNLPQAKRESIANLSMVLFPEVFSSRSDKYSRFAIWLLKNEGVVCPNARDVFSASGQKEFTINGKTFEKIPRVCINLLENLDSILAILVSISASELSEFWNKRTSESTKIIDWIDLVSDNAKNLRGAKHLNFKQMLTKLIS